jgi:hypothetical protein
VGAGEPVGEIWSGSAEGVKQNELARYSGEAATNGLLSPPHRRGLRLRRAWIEGSEAGFRRPAGHLQGRTWGDLSGNLERQY